MILTKRLLLAMVAAGLAAIPMAAGPLTWNIGGSGGGTAGFSLTDGTHISGTFSYNADVSTANCGASCGNPTPGTATAAEPQPADYNGLYGLFGSGIDGGGAQTGTTGGVTGSITVAPGSFLASAGSLTWYINTNDYDASTGADCCSDSTHLYLVSGNPTTTADFDQDTNGGTTYYGIEISLADPMTDAGSLYAPGDVVTSAYLSTCHSTQCGSIYTPTQVSLADAQANVNTGNYPSSGTPEPSTFLLGVSALAVGAFRKKIFRARQ